MGKSVRKILDPLKLPDPLDVWGEKAEQQRKDMLEQGELDRQAMKEAQAGSAPTMDSEAVSAAREAERRRRASAAGQSSTILTGAAGLGANTNSGKQLLGQ